MDRSDMAPASHDIPTRQRQILATEHLSDVLGDARETTQRSHREAKGPEVARKNNSLSRRRRQSRKCMQAPLPSPINGAMCSASELRSS